MIRASTFAGKTVAVFGLGSSGNATVRALLDGGATVAAWDDSAAGREAAAKAGIPIVDLTAADWSQFSSLVLAPGVPLTHPEPHWTVTRAQTAGVEIIGDVEIFFRERAAHGADAPVIAITGTNGKSTTTALTAHILKHAGYDVQMGGNIGRAVLTLEPFEAGRHYVLELSSFQIDLTPSLAPTVGVLLNITPDHIDRHGTIENYAAVKERLVAGAETSIVSLDDSFCETIAKRIETPAKAVRRARGYGAGVIPFSVIQALDYGYSCIDGHIREGRLGQQPGLVDIAGVPTLRGKHNWQNATAAVAAVRSVPVEGGGRAIDLATLHSALKSFPGLAHRMELVTRYGPIDFVNDSKATNADSTEKALLSWDRNIFWIAGGKSKAGGIESLRPYFNRVRKAYLIGEATEEFAATLCDEVEFVRCGTLDVAVKAAFADAKAQNGSDSVVLLSPACASYDQFKNFEVRGDAFRAAVAALPGVTLRRAP